jgi:hypothetical protein
VQERVARGESVPIKEAASAADDVVKRITGNQTDGVKMGSTQRETVGSLPSSTNNLERSPAKTQAGSAGSESASRSRTAGRAPSSQRTASHRSGMAVAFKPAEGATSSASSPDRFDFVSEYGLFLLRPEIITLYDSDPEVEQSGKTTSAFDFANLQQATAKTLQEKSYRPTRRLLSSITSNPAIPFEQSDLEKLRAETPIERNSTSVFEQAVARWDGEKKRVTAAEDKAAQNAIVAQSLATALDVVNSLESFSETISGDVSLRDIIKKAVESVKAKPTADPLLVAGRYYTRHDFLHKVQSAGDWVEKLLYTNVPPTPDLSGATDVTDASSSGASSTSASHIFNGLVVEAPSIADAADASRISGEKSLDFTTYSMMHALLQNAFFCFAFGSQRTSVGRDTVSKARTSNINSAYIYKIGTGRVGSVASNKIFIHPERLPTDAADSGQSGFGIAESIFSKLSALAAYRSSHLYDPEKTAIEVFQARIGLPVSFLTRDTSGSSITDFERAATGSVVNQLFQVIDAAEGKKIVYFDRNRSASLPSGYTHGYPKIFGTGGEAAAASSDLASRVNASLTAIDEISSALLAGSIGDRKASEAGTILLERFAELLKPITEDSVLGFADFHTDFAYKEYNKYLDLYAGTGLSPDVTIPVHPYRNIEQALSLDGAIETLSAYKSIQAITEDRNNLNSFPAFATLEYLLFLTNGAGSAVIDTTGAFDRINNYGEEKLRKLTLFLQEKYISYWKQLLGDSLGQGRVAGEEIIRLDSTLVSAAIEECGFADDSDLRVTLNRFYGYYTKMEEIEKFAEPCIRRIVEWSIQTATLMFPDGFGSSRDGLEISAIFEYSRTTGRTTQNSKTYTLADICYQLTIFASYYAKGIFTELRMPDKLDRRNFANDADATSRTNESSADWDTNYLLTEFSRAAGAYVSRFASQTQTSFDDARLGLEVVAEQLKAVRSGLESVTTSNSPLLEDGKFNMLFTPIQAAGITLRKAEFLERSRISPFQSWRYDELQSVRSLERSAISALYRSDLMRQDDTKVLFVGLPTGIQHSVGITQHYVKVTVARKDSGLSTEYEPLVFYFDMFKFCSPELCVAARTAPWSVKPTGNIEEAVSNLKMFKIDLQGNRTYGNFSLADQSTSISASASGLINVKHITSPIYYDTAGNSAGNVLVSDLTVTCEFLGARAAASDTGTIPELVRTSPKIDGNHLVDVLLKAHVKRMSGLDLSEPVFTTSRSAFGTGTTAGLNDIGQYVFDLCATSIVGTKKDNPTAAAFDIKMLEIISRSPIARADSYAELCLKPTYFDRVFAMPINLRQFKVK